MAKDGKRFMEKLIGKAVELMPAKHYEAPEIAPVKKELKDSRVALITTAGVHLKEDEPFDTTGSDPTYRVVPGNTKMEDLMITHGHYDDSQAHLDINVVFPIDRLRELKEEGVIESIAENFYTFRGYIPKTRPLIKRSAPAVAEALVRDGVDIAILTPGWYICHQSVGLIQREIEKQGIRTASIMHLPKVAKKVRPPRMMHIRFPLGKTFGMAGDVKLQRSILEDLINFALEGEPESLVELSYRWKRPISGDESGD